MQFEQKRCFSCETAIGKAPIAKPVKIPFKSGTCVIKIFTAVISSVPW
jgi:hypothetical protein